MARVMKPPSNFKDSVDTGGDWYDGPPPTPGIYAGTVKKMLLTKVKGGEKDGELRIMVVCEINDGKFKGAGVSKWLQITEQGAPWLNQFLRSLTDGSDAQFKGIREAFWDIGYAVDDADDKGRLPIVRIGKKTNPIGLPTMFSTKLRPGTDGVTRAEIVRFISKAVDSTTSDDDEDVEDDALVEDSADETYDVSGMDEFASDDEDDDPWSNNG